jgi:hypothetical protein
LSTSSHEVVKLDLTAGSVQTILVDGKPQIVLKPAVEELGLDYSTQLAKLRKRSWAVVGQSPTTGSDGKTYEMAVVPVRTFLMLLATINENRVAAPHRRTLIAFQNETADAIEAYWTQRWRDQPEGQPAAARHPQRAGRVAARGPPP